MTDGDAYSTGEEDEVAVEVLPATGRKENEGDGE